MGAPTSELIRDIVSAMSKGYGLLIAQARGGNKPAWLGKKIGKSTSTVNRIESESTALADAEVINDLVKALPISTEQLIKATGVALISDEKAAAIWDSFYYDWVRLSQEQKEHVARLASSLAAVSAASQPDQTQLPLGRLRGRSTGVSA